ncbi:MAG: M23 family metallopeptidase, partial [Cyclobacteriaceae bacterium]
MKYLAPILLLLFISCQEETTDQLKDLTIADAKSHFINATQNNLLREDSPINDFEVLWDLGEYREISLGDALSFPIDYQSDLVVSGTNGAIKSKSEKMTFVFAYVLDGEIHVETVRKIPTRVTEKFTGYMLVENLQGEVIRYLEFEDGEFTAEYEVVDGENGRLVCTVTEYYTCTVRQGAADDCVLDKTAITCVQEKTLAGVGVTPGGGDYGPSGPGDSNDVACEEENGYFADGAGNCVKECTEQQRTDGECCDYGTDKNGDCIPCPSGVCCDLFGEELLRCLEDIPCPGDPLVGMEITSPGSSGVNGGRYGCTRFGTGCDENPNRKFHDGIDLTAPMGSYVFAAFPGKVVQIRNSFDAMEYGRNSYGNFVIIESTSSAGIKIRMKYNHLDFMDMMVGQTVDLGMLLGRTGATGNASGSGVTPHLHLQAQVKVGTS